MADPRAYVAAVALALMPGVGTAATWQLVSSDPGVTAYYDASSVQIAGSKRTVWTKIVNEPPKQFDFRGESVVLTNTTARTQFDCKNRSSKTFVEIGYKEGGQVAYQVNEPTPDRAVFPDTRGEEILLAVCALAPRSAAK